MTDPVDERPPDDLRRGPDGRLRCAWSGATVEYVAYHDAEWGRPVHDDVRLFEKLCLEGFQAGLSWLTVLRKREAFRLAFANFEPAKVAAFGEADVTRLLRDASIIRSRAKIEAAIANGRAMLALGDTTLAELVWAHAPPPRPALVARAARVDPRVGRAGQGVQAARLPIRRRDHRVRHDAGVRRGRRPPGRLLRPRRADP